MAASNNDADSPAVAEHDAHADFDVFVHGTVFFDLIFTGLESVPPPGVELQASGMGSSPGGIANLATASSRLGLLTSMSAAFGDDVYGDFCWSTLSEQEGVDLSSSRRFAGWHSPVTVSMATHGDRSMVTHSHPPPMTASTMIGAPPRARTVVADLDDGSWADGEAPQWLRHARSQGATVFADIGWDESGEWAPSKLDLLSECDAFLPNAGEAMAYTRTDSPRDALYALADRVPIAVVTNGADGAMAIDSRTGEEAQVPALNVPAIDATGAGDVFVAGIVLGTLGEWPLTDRLAFAALCAALAVQQFGGSLSSPGLAEVLEWWRTLNSDDRSNAYVTSLRRRYAFLDDIRLPTNAHARRLAQATFSTHSGSHMTPR